MIAPCRGRILMLLCCGLIFAAVVRSQSPDKKTLAPDQIWFGDLPNDAVLQDLKDGAVNCLKAALAGRQIENEPACRKLAQDATPRILFLSVSDGKSRARVQLACEKGMGPALKKLITSLPAKAESKKWVKFDIAEKGSAVAGAAWLFPLPLEPGIDGLAFGRSMPVAFLPQEVPSYALLTKEKLLREDKLAAQINGPAPENLNEIYRFTTTSFFFGDSDAGPLYRGHRLFDSVSAEQASEAAKQAGLYLAGATGKDGRFVYEYRPSEDMVPADYNMVRHAGTVYAMFELYGETRDHEVLAAAKRASQFLKRKIQVKQIDGQEVGLLLDEGAARLGGNALAIIALLKCIEVTGDRQDLTLIRQLGLWIQKNQDTAGRFTVHKLDVSDGKTVDFESRYYPGEAILAMIRLHRLDPEGKWADTAERGARYLIEVRDKGLTEEDIQHDHWLLYALNEVHRVRPRKEFLDHAMLISRAIMKAQTTQEKYPDWIGGFLPPPRSNRAATRTEALCAAFQLARDYEQPEKAGIRTAIQRAIAFQLGLQHRPETVMHFKDPQRCLGGFAESLTDSDIRIDTVQHNISSLLGAAKIFKGAISQGSRTEQKQ